MTEPANTNAKPDGRLTDQAADHYRFNRVSTVVAEMGVAVEDVTLAEVNRRLAERGDAPTNGAELFRVLAIDFGYNPLAAG